VDQRGNLSKGALICGGACVIVAALVPFSSLDNLISSGVLLSFNLANSSLLVLRNRCPP
ncbi:unnamed protein product, partial [Discosporangium mesarthrocarpum]